MSHKTPTPTNPSTNASEQGDLPTASDNAMSPKHYRREVFNSAVRAGAGFLLMAIAYVLYLHKGFALDVDAPTQRHTVLLLIAAIGAVSVVRGYFSFRLAYRALAPKA